MQAQKVPWVTGYYKKVTTSNYVMILCKIKCQVQMVLYPALPIILPYILL